MSMCASVAEEVKSSESVYQSVVQALNLHPIKVSHHPRNPTPVHFNLDFDAASEGSENDQTNQPNASRSPVQVESKRERERERDLYIYIYICILCIICDPLNLERFT